MIDMTNMSRDFIPKRRRPEEEGFASPAGHVRPDIQATGLPQGVQMETETFTPPPGGGQPQVSTGQPQPFAPVGGQPSGQVPQLPYGGKGQTPQMTQETFGERPNGSGTNLYGLGYDTSQFRGAPQVGTQQQPFTPVGGQPQVAFPPPGPGQPPGGGRDAFGNQIGPSQEQIEARRRYLEQAGGGFDPETGSWLDAQGGVIDQPQGGMPGGGVPSGGSGEPPPGGGGFPYPEQWGQAGDIYGQLAGGMPGMPDPGAMWGGYEQQAGDLSRELAEQAGMGAGTRYGSALQRNIADVGMRAGERFGGEMERMRMGDVAGQRQAMLGAAGGLSGLGGAYAMLPGQLSGQAMGLGQQYQGMQQQEYDRQRQEWMRQQPEYSPYLPYMQQGAQVPYGPQTYQPGWGSNMMDIGGMMGMYGMMGGGW